MGYNTTVTGSLTITPPLTWKEIRSYPFKDEENSEVLLSIEDSTTETEKGTLHVKSAVAIVPRWDEAYKAYDLLDHVQRVIDRFPNHTFSGRLECEGDEAGDLWRVIVRNGRAIRVEPKIVWPDES